MPDSFHVRPLERPPDCSVTIPGSKSHTNRALVCAALAAGTSCLQGALFAEDTAAMIGALGDLGVVIRSDETDSTITVEGRKGMWEVTSTELDVNQSGTTGRFVLPLLALGPGPYTLDGDPQLRERPFSQLVDALSDLGVSIEGRKLPLTVTNGSDLGGRVALPGSTSSQFLSGLLLSAPAFSQKVEIEIEDEVVSKPYVELTLSTMASFGVTVEHKNYQRFIVDPQPYQHTNIAIEPDASAASYFFAAAAITKGRVRINGLDTSTVQGDLLFVDVLEKMGATVVRGAGWTEVQGPETLSGIHISMADISDTVQTLAIVATFATSPTTISEVGFIRYKETDRIKAVVSELSRQGIRAVELEDGLQVYPGKPNGSLVETYGDHRMAMSFALLGLSHDGIAIADPGCVAKTFPNYFEVLATLG